MKFGRIYRLTIQTSSTEAVVIQPPFSIDFTINRGVMAALNSMQLKIKNLAPTTRNKIFQDWFNPSVYKKIILEAGHGELCTIFQGNIFQAYTYKEHTEIVTYIDARDGGFDTSNTRTNTTIQKNTDIKDLVTGLVNSFPNLQVGAIGSFDGSLGRPAVLDGNTFDLIQKYTGGKSYIDLEKVYALKDGEVITGGIPLIRSDTGLLGVPVRSDAYLVINTMFEPRVILGQIIEIQSSVQHQYDGQYKTVGLNHSGTISDAIGGNCQSRFSLMLGTKIIGGLKAV
jgi:hypothetical protein